MRDKYPVVHTRLARLQFDTPNKVQQRQKDTFFFTASYRYPLLDRQFDICGQSAGRSRQRPVVSSSSSSGPVKQTTSEIP